MQIIDKNEIKEITPEIISELFCHMSQDEQARFFNHISEIATKWFCFQLQYITDDNGLTYGGRRVMQEIGEYSHWGLVPRINNEGKVI